MVVEHGAGGRQVRVASLPLGVPFERFGSLAEVAPPATIDKPREAQVTKYRWQLLDVLNLTDATAQSQYSMTFFCYHK